MSLSLLCQVGCQEETSQLERFETAAEQLLQSVGGCEGEERCAERCQTLISGL